MDINISGLQNTLTYFIEKVYFIHESKNLQLI